MFRKGWRRQFVLAMVAAAAADGQVTKAPRTLEEFNVAIDELVRHVAPSVVQIMVNGYGPQTTSENVRQTATYGRQRAIGSGFVIDSGGYIMTNAHVVSGAERIQVVLPPVDLSEAIASALSTRTHSVAARVVGVAADLDIALLKVDGVELPALPLAAYRSLRQGEMVFAFGSPEGLRNTVTQGVVSAVARQNDPDSPRIAIQTDASINPGNSGGPLVNVKGEVVGMDTFILSQSGGNEGLNFAIPCATLRVAYRQLKQFGRLRRQEIGVSIQTITPDMAKGLGLSQDWGVIISDTLPGGPAEQAGIKPGDVLKTVDGQLAENVPTVSYNFLLRDSGEKMHVEVLRGQRPMTFDVPVMEEHHDLDDALELATPDKNLVSEIGILGVEIDKKLEPLLGQLRHRYGIIVAARTSGAARDVSLMQGDVILELNGVLTMTLDALRSGLKRLKPGDPAVLQVERDGKLMYLAFTPD
jgi:serine protease Do